MLNRFSQYCQTWIQEAPVWNWWLQQFERRYSKEIPPGIVATWFRGRPTLLFHPSWLGKITEAAFGSALEHAITHFILGHPKHYLVLAKHPSLDDLLDGQVAYHLGQLSENRESNLDWSNPLLYSKMEKQPEFLRSLPESLTSGQAMHQVWLDQNKEQIEVNTLLYKQVLVRAAQTIEVGFPSRLEEFIKQKVMKPNISWQQILRRFVWRYGRKVMAYSNHRKSKRYGSYPGIKHRKKGRLLVAVDTSGSVKEHVLEAFFEELNSLYRLGVSIDIVESDHRIQRKYGYAGTVPKSIAGRGGTDFNPVFRYVRDQSAYDGLIYFTDGLGPAPQLSIKIPILCAIFGPNDRSLLEWSHFPGQKLMINL